MLFSRLEARKIQIPASLPFQAARYRRSLAHGAPACRDRPRRKRAHACQRPRPTPRRRRARGGRKGCGPLRGGQACAPPQDGPCRPRPRPRRHARRSRAMWRVCHACQLPALPRRGRQPRAGGARTPKKGMAGGTAWVRAREQARYISGGPASLPHGLRRRGQSKGDVSGSPLHRLVPRRPSVCQRRGQERVRVQAGGRGRVVARRLL